MTKVINGFSNYTISSEGVVTSVRRVCRGILQNKPIVMQPQLSGKNRNYPTVNLIADDGTRHHCKIHRLVAVSFIPNPYRLPQVNHIDGNPQNNKVENLEWCNNSQNQIHAYKTGLKRIPNGHLNHRYGKEGFYKDKRGDEHPKSIRVVKLSLNGVLISGYESATLAAESVGKCSGGSSNILKACRGEIKQSYGFRWCFPTSEHKYLYEEYVR